MSGKRNCDSFKGLGSHRGLNLNTFKTFIALLGKGGKKMKWKKGLLSPKEYETLFSMNQSQMKPIDFIKMKARERKEAISTMYDVFDKLKEKGCINDKKILELGKKVLESQQIISNKEDFTEIKPRSIPITKLKIGGQGEVAIVDEGGTKAIIPKVEELNQISPSTKLYVKPQKGTVTVEVE